MAHFARALHQVAYQTDAYLYFMSLVGLSNRKGCTCFRFLLCQYVMYRDFSEADMFRMMLIEKNDMKSIRDIKESVGPLWPRREEEVENAVLLCDDRWVDAIPQLYEVVVGRWYGDSSWVKVSFPKKWRGKSSITLGRVEKRSRNGSSRIVRLSQKEKQKLADIQELKEKRAALWRRRHALKIYSVGSQGYTVSPLNQDEYDRHGQSIERINQEIFRIATKKTTIDPKFEQPFRRIPVRKRQLVLV